MGCSYKRLPDTRRAAAALVKRWKDLCGEIAGFAQVQMRRIPGCLELAAQSVVDFLIEDRCVLCGGYPSSPLRPSDESIGIYSPYLLRPVRLRLLRILTLENHPVCTRCLRGFDEARSVGILGRVSGGNTVVTSAGERFPFSVPERRRAELSLQASSPTLRAPDVIPVIAPFMVGDNALKLVHLVKFSGYRALIPLLGHAIAAAVANFYPEIPRESVLVPVPMSRRDERRRGFNQAEWMGRELSRRLAIPMDPEVLRRARLGKRQAQTRRDERADNVRGAFAATGDLATAKHVLLVDDLVTTGATAAACASALFASGALSVTVLCFGRSL